LAFLVGTDAFAGTLKGGSIRTFPPSAESGNTCEFETSSKEYETGIFSDDLRAASARAEEVIKANQIPEGESAGPACPAAGASEHRIVEKSIRTHLEH
jgi:hypothetical protein